MKKTKIYLGVLLFATATIFSSCRSSKTQLTKKRTSATKKDFWTGSCLALH